MAASEAMRAHAQRGAGRHAAQACAWLANVLRAFRRAHCFSKKRELGWMGVGHACDLRGSTESVRRQSDAARNELDAFSSIDRRQNAGADRLVDLRCGVAKGSTYAVHAKNEVAGEEPGLILPKLELLA